MPQVGTRLTDFLIDQIPTFARRAVADKKISWEEHALFGFVCTQETPSWRPTISFLAREFGTSRAQVRRMIKHLVATAFLDVTTDEEGIHLHALCPTSEGR